MTSVFFYDFIYLFSFLSHSFFLNNRYYKGKALCVTSDLTVNDPDGLEVKI